MDERSFDRLARLLGGASDRRSGLKALVGGILGAGGLAALDDGTDAKRRDARRGAKARRDGGPDADRRRKKRKKKCNPPCAAGFACVKGTCTCSSGVACNGACCASGQACRDGACVEPLGACLAFGDACKGAGRRCCDGLSCASGQDGSYPVACYRSKGAACATTAECPFGMSCTGGVCLGNGGGGGVPTGAPCTAGANCDQPGAVCTAYTGADAPAGDFCTLPLRKVCTGDIDCTCYRCWYVNGGAEGTSRAGRSSVSTKACCHQPGESCATENDCCYNLDCIGNVCTGSTCVPAGGACADGPCCDGATCQGGVCGGGGGGCAFPGTNLAFDAPCCESSQCSTGLCWYPQTGDMEPDGTQKVCVVATGGACGENNDVCGLGNECNTDSGFGALGCSDYNGDYNGSYRLRVPTGGTGCDSDHPCYDEQGAYCSSGTCVARTPKTIKQPCNPATDICVNGQGDPESSVTCQTYSNGVGSGATDTTSTYCLGGYPYETTDTSECASLRTFSGACTGKCNVYLAAGQTDAERGAALKTALEAFRQSEPFDYFRIEPDQANGTAKYQTAEITIDLEVAANYPNDDYPNLVIDNCYSFYGSAPRRPVVTGNNANRILNATAATSTNKGLWLKNLDLENGNATGNGGAIRISTPNASHTAGADFNVLERVKVSNSTASGDGGGVWVEGPFALVDTRVESCTAGGKGGGVYVKTVDNQFFAPGFQATITSNAANSTSDAMPGAGVYWEGTASNQVACGSGSSITGNTDASTKKDCAYGTTSTGWSSCGCGQAET